MRRVEDNVGKDPWRQALDRGADPVEAGAHDQGGDADHGDQQHRRPDFEALDPDGKSEAREHHAPPRLALAAAR
jgi:hypothetical protein